MRIFLLYTLIKIRSRCLIEYVVVQLYPGWIFLFYFIIIIGFFFVCLFSFLSLFFSLNIRPTLNPNEFNFFRVIASRVSCSPRGRRRFFWLAFIDRARGKRARPGTFVLKSLKNKTVACYVDSVSIM